jgi:hypothetical protein
MNRAIWWLFGAASVLGIIYLLAPAYADDKPATAPKADASVTKTIAKPEAGYEVVMVEDATGTMVPMKRKIDASKPDNTASAVESGDKVTLVTVELPAETKREGAADKATPKWEVPEGAELVTDSAGRTRLRMIAPATTPAANTLTRDDLVAAMTAMRQPAPQTVYVPTPAPAYSSSEEMVDLRGTDGVVRRVPKSSLGANAVHCTPQTCGTPATPAPAQPQQCDCKEGGDTTCNSAFNLSLVFAPRGGNNYYPHPTRSVPRAQYPPRQQPPRARYCPPPPPRRDPRPCPPSRNPGRSRGR